MYHRQRRKITFLLFFCFVSSTLCKSIVISEKSNTNPVADHLENIIIDFVEDHSTKFNRKYGVVPWDSNDKFNKAMHRYTLINNKVKDTTSNVSVQNNTENISQSVEGTTSINDYSVIPLELISTTENELLSIIDSTTEDDLTVIPLSTTKKISPIIEITQTVILPTSTQTSDTTEYEIVDRIIAENYNGETTTIKREVTSAKNTETTTTDVTNSTTTDVTNITTTDVINITPKDVTNITPREVTNIATTDVTNITTTDISNITTTDVTNIATTYVTNITTTDVTNITTTDVTNITTTDVTYITTTDVTNIATTEKLETVTVKEDKSTKVTPKIETKTSLTTVTPKSQKKVTKPTAKILKTNSRVTVKSKFPDSLEIEEDVPSFSHIDALDIKEVPEDYYDGKDVIPTSPPKNDAFSVIVGFAGSVVESVAEKVVPKSIYDLFKRMQKQNEALEAERLRSREENGGLGQFGRGILKSISSGLSKPFNQLMAGVRDIGSLDSDRRFLSSVGNVANVANSVSDAFKDRVQAIYPGTVWCGDGHSASARSSDLGLFFFTDTCCRQHDACRIYIQAGETKYGLTNTGLFTRSHCSCDIKFRDCLRKTNSLVSAQIGLTYFNVLGPQCFRKAHPIVKCVKRTRITGQKCEEYQLDYTKPKMWQWFDNETF